jgi:periplasmic protein TonB
MLRSTAHVMQIATTAIWVTCVTGALVGFSVRRELPHQSLIEKKDKTIRIETLTVIEEPQTEPVQESQELSSLESPPQMPFVDPPEALPDIPDVSEVQEEMPAPIKKNATKIQPKLTAEKNPVELKNPSVKQSIKPTAPKIVTDNKFKGSPAGNNKQGPPKNATRLTFGSGEGRQPAPSYPLQARKTNQQGTVTIEFIVSAEGKVTSAWVKNGSSSSLLNSAALSTVRGRWKFPPGAARHYVVPIVFRLN